MANNRLFREARIGNVQAWSAQEGGTAVAVSVYAGVQHAGSKESYISQTLNLTVADARDLAALLIEAADFADVRATDLGADAAIFA